MNRKSLVVVLVAVIAVLLPSAVWATGGKEAGTGGGIVITWLGRIDSGETTTWDIQQLEQKFGVTIRFNGVDPNDSEKRSVMMASGQSPDAWDAWKDEIFSNFNEGMTRAFPKAMITQNMPNYSRMLTDQYPVGWLMAKKPGATDQYLAIHGIGGFADSDWYIAFNTQWAKNVGFNLPADYNQRKVSLDRFKKTYFLDWNISLDDYEKLLVAFRDGDPDRNGKNDTIPFAAQKSFTYTWAGILGAFGVGENYNLIENGKLVEWNISQGYRDFLKLAARWYKQGLVDKEYLSLDFDKAWEKVKNRLVASGNVEITYADQTWALDRPPNTFATDKDVAAGEEVVILPPPVGPGGRQGAVNKLPAGPLGSYYEVFNAKVSDEKLAKILQILDYIRFGDAEAWVNAYAGKPDVHFKWQGEPWKTAPIPVNYNDVPSGYPKQGSFPTVYPPGRTPDKAQFVSTAAMASFVVNHMQKELSRLDIRPYRWDLLNETKLSDLQAKYGATLDTIRDEFMNQAIQGQVDVDAGWDAYVKKWLDNGGSEIIAEEQKAPLVSELLKGKIVH